MIFDWLRRVAKRYRQFCLKMAIESEGAVLVTTKSGLVVPKSAVWNIVTHLQRMHEKRYADFCILAARARENQEVLDEQLLDAFFDTRSVADGQTIVILEKETPMQICQLVRDSIGEQMRIVSPVPGMSLEKLMVPFSLYGTQ